LKVLVSDKLSEKGVEILRQGGLDVDVKTGLDKEEIKKIIGDYDALVVRSATKVTSDIIENAKKLKAIGRAGIGVDNIDIAAASKRGILVMNTPGGNSITTGEHTIAMMMALTRNIPQAVASMKAEKWEKKKFSGREVFNKTLGIIGMGRVGSVVASRAQGFKMNVIAYDPFISKEVAEKMGVEIVELDEIFARSDYITLHTPLTKETRGIINKEAFSKMKDGVMIINCARGPLIDNNALIEALDSGKVAGAAIDVYEKEPPDDWTLVKHPKVICTPHLGASTEEAQENVAVAVAHQIIDYLNKGVIANALNAPSVAPEILPRVMPYAELAEKMGVFAGQVFTGRIEKINVNYSGDVADLDVSPVTVSLLKGIFSVIVSDVNNVNAPFIAKERGIDVIESRSSRAETYSNMIEVQVELDSATRSMAGSLFKAHDLRIVRIDNYPIEVIPEKNMLVVYNKDLPGTVGNIGIVLGDANINIARLFLGRDREQGTAIIIINLDSEVPDEVIQKLENIPNIISVQQVIL